MVGFLHSVFAGLFQKVIISENTDIIIICDKIIKIIRLFQKYILSLPEAFLLFSFFVNIKECLQKPRVFLQIPEKQ